MEHRRGRAKRGRTGTGDGQIDSKSKAGMHACRRAGRAGRCRQLPTFITSSKSFSPLPTSVPAYQKASA